MTTQVQNIIGKPDQVVRCSRGNEYAAKKQGRCGGTTLVKIKNGRTGYIRRPDDRGRI